MKFLYLIICLTLTTSVFSQESFTEKDAKQLIDVFFEGFHKGDTLLMRSVLEHNVTMNTVYSDKSGNNIIKTGSVQELLVAISKRPENDIWDERLEDYSIQIDGNLAHVWTPYQFWFNGNLSHCGANAFTLAKTDDGWKIVHLIDSRRKESCKSE